MSRVTTALVQKATFKFTFIWRKFRKLPNGSFIHVHIPKIWTCAVCMNLLKVLYSVTSPKTQTICQNRRDRYGGNNNNNKKTQVKTGIISEGGDRGTNPLMGVSGCRGGSMSAKVHCCLQMQSAGFFKKSCLWVTDPWTHGCPGLGYTLYSGISSGLISVSVVVAWFGLQLLQPFNVTESVSQRGCFHRGIYSLKWILPPNSYASGWCIFKETCNLF